MAQQLPNIQAQLSSYLPSHLQPIQAIVTEGHQHNHLLNSNSVQPFSTRHGAPSQFRMHSLLPLSTQVSLPGRSTTFNSGTGRLNGVAQLHVGGETTDNDHAGRENEFEIQPSGSPDTFFSLSGTSSNARRPIQRFILSTNQSQEVAYKYRRTPVPRHRHNLYKPPSLSSSDTSQIEEKPFKSSLAIRKLHLGTVKQSGDIESGSSNPVSYGGSFGAPSEFAVSTRNLRTFNNLRPFTSRKFPEGEEGVESLSHEAPIHLHTPRPSAPTLIFQPAQRTIAHEINQQDLSGIYRTAHTTYQPSTTAPRYFSEPTPTVRPIESPPSFQNELETKQKSLDGLLDCCYRQAPGCQHLCTPNVSKEQVRQSTYLLVNCT